MKAWSVVAVALLVVGCSRPDASEFVAGLSQAQLIERFGKADYISNVEASRVTRAMGPATPTFVRSLPPEEPVVVWEYQVKGGAVQLYFHKGEQIVAVTFRERRKR